jgi:hypothetical protein
VVVTGASVGSAVMPLGVADLERVDAVADREKARWVRSKC